jgi:ABC-type transporter lipoprotein component MlaA
MNKGMDMWSFVKRYVALLGLVAVLAGCASGPGAHPSDPLEPWNRGVHGFNEAVDTAVFKPVASAYTAVTPSPVRTGVSNFLTRCCKAARWKRQKTSCVLMSTPSSAWVGCWT